MITSQMTGSGQRRLSRRARLLPLLALLLAACGGGGDKVTTTTSVPSSTTSTSPATTASTTVGSTTNTAVIQPTPTEAAGAELADGRHPVYLAAVDAANRTITVDVVQVLDRRSSEAATVCPDIARGDIDGYCIKNANPRLRTLAVQTSASLQVLDGSSLRTTDIAGLAAARQPEKEQSFFEISVTSAQVTAAKEIYRA